MSEIFRQKECENTVDFIAQPTQPATENTPEAQGPFCGVGQMGFCSYWSRDGLPLLMLLNSGNFELTSSLKSSEFAEGWFLCDRLSAVY